jgi:hypothetical protein
MAKNPKAGIEVGINDRPAIEGLRNLARSFGAFSVQAAGALTVAQAGWSALTGAIGAVVDVTSEYVKLAMEQERVERRAIAAIQTRASFSREELALLQEANAARQMQLGIGDEVQLQLQGTMAAMGVNKAQLDAATKAAIGLSEAMGMGLEEAAKLSAKALTGNVAALQEYGIRVGSVSEAQTALNALYEQAVAQSSTLATRYQVLTANIGDLQEVIGQTVTSSGVAKDALDALSAATVQLQTFFASSDGKELVNQFFSVITIGAADAIDAMLGAYRVMQSLRGQSDRGSVLSRIGGAGRLVGAVQPGALLARALGFGGGLQGGAAEIKDAFDQLMGRGVEALGDSPLVQTATELADRLRAAAKSAVDVQSTLGGGAGGRRGGGAGEALPSVSVEIGPIKSARLAQLENEIQTQMELEDGMRAALRENQAALAREQADLERQIETERVTERNQARMDAYNQEQEAAKAHYQVLGDLTKQGAGIVSSSISDLLVAWASGADMAEMTVGRFVGTMISQIGVMLIQTGIAASVLGALSFIPGLQGIAGPPGLGIAGGLAATGAGLAMVALGSAMGGGAPRGGSAGASRTSGGGTAGSRGFDPVPRGFGGVGRDMAAAPSYNIAVSFGVVGDERRAARMIRDVLERGR